MSEDESRRRFLRKAVYVPPMILSFKAVPAFARPGSVIERLPSKVTITDDLLGGRIRLDPGMGGPREYRGGDALLDPALPGHLERRGVVEAGEQNREPGSVLNLANGKRIDTGTDTPSGLIPARKKSGS
jgi:hypothetical protein